MAKTILESFVETFGNKPEQPVYQMAAYRGDGVRIIKEEKDWAVVQFIDGTTSTVPYRELVYYTCAHKVGVAGPNCRHEIDGVWYDSNGRCFDCNKKVR